MISSDSGWRFFEHGGGGREESSRLRSCHTRKGVATVRFRFQKRYVAQKFRGSLFKRRGCATSVYRFWKLHLRRCDKDSAPSLSSLPHAAFAKSRTDKRNSALRLYTIMHSINLFEIASATPCFEMERLRSPSQRSSESQAKGTQPCLSFVADTTFAVPLRFAAERTVPTSQWGVE